MHPLVVTTEALLPPRGGSRSTTTRPPLEALLAESAKHTALGARRLDRKDATRAAAASATVALVEHGGAGTAGSQAAAQLMTGVSPIRLLAIRDTALSVDEVLAAVADPRAGGIAVFLGVVRNHDEDRAVAELGYSAHPSAEQELRDVAEDGRRDVPGVRAGGGAPYRRPGRGGGGRGRGRLVRPPG